MMTDDNRPDAAPDEPDAPEEVFVGEVVLEEEDEDEDGYDEEEIEYHPDLSSIRGDGRNPGQDYSDLTKERAKLYYTLGRQKMTHIAEILGVPISAVRHWKTKNQPGDENWDELREAMKKPGWSGLAEGIGESGAEEAGHMLFLGRMLREVVLEAVTVGPLFDHAGTPVEFLHDKEGKKVLVGGLRPKTMTEVSQMLNVVMKIGDLRDVETELREKEDEMGNALLETMHSLLSAAGLSPAQWQRFKMKQNELRTSGKLPKALGGKTKVSKPEEDVIDVEVEEPEEDVAEDDATEEEEVVDDGE